ncbi:hypothetical protein HPB47_017414, partial [Ixodes persulcatus]
RCGISTTLQPSMDQKTESFMSGARWRSLLPLPCQPRRTPCVRRWSTSCLTVRAT